MYISKKLIGLFWLFIACNWLFQLYRIIVEKKYPDHFTIGTSVFITFTTVLMWAFEAFEDSKQERK